MSSLPRQQVRRRRVFYIPGYDPISPRRYREIYRAEGRAQAAISGYEIELVGRPGGAVYGWDVTARIDGAETRAEVEVLVWSDIVRASMDRGVWATYLALVRTAWVYIASGAFIRMFRLRKGPVVAALYPVLMLLGQALLAGLLGGAVLWAVLALVGAGTVAGWVLGLGLGALAGGLLLRWFRRIDNRLYVYYLMHDYAFSAMTRGANPPELEERMAQFADRIAAALETDVDEVLVVGHSSGAHLGVSILADLFRAGRVPRDGPKLAFLTLGQVVPMISFLPEAARLRRDLHDLSREPGLTWVDVSAPGDGCAFALCDPVSVSGVAPAEGKLWPLVISAAFTQTLSPERWKALRWLFFRLHFQYLCAFDRPGDYDYFQITAGPLTLAERYAGRAPSRSLIDRPVSGHRSMAP
ncbi:MAG: hypothetical protein D6801_08075 [Alphaproteobacteria bacterium]|nr:MAG: hypothetical protein D6801_08075 [Alphaproteobacteria bacterium]